MVSPINITEMQIGKAKTIQLAVVIKRTQQALKNNYKIEASEQIARQFTKKDCQLGR